MFLAYAFCLLLVGQGLKEVLVAVLAEVSADGLEGSRLCRGPAIRMDYLCVLRHLWVESCSSESQCLFFMA